MSASPLGKKAAERLEVVRRRRNPLWRALAQICWLIPTWFLAILGSEFSSVPGRHRYEIRDRRNGRVLSVADDDLLNDVDLGALLEYDLGASTLEEFASAWGLNAEDV